MYAQLAVRGLDTNMIGTPLTVKLSESFDQWLAAEAAAVRADTYQEFAESLRERYPEDVFIKPNDEDYHALNLALNQTGISLDRFSADLMRRAAAQADAEAAAIRAQLKGAE